MVLWFAWKRRLRLNRKGEKLWDKGNRVAARAEELNIKGARIRQEAALLKLRPDLTTSTGNECEAKYRIALARSAQLHAQSNRLSALGDLLHSKGSELIGKGDLIWSESVTYLYGPVKVVWSDGNCTLEDGRTYHAE
jgi:hypothetical protein